LSYVILSVGFEFPGGDVENISLNSGRSILDGDIIVFKPCIPNRSAYETYMGKPKLSEAASFESREALAHWNSEILAAYEAGKLIVVFLAAPEEVYADTGRKNYSGTGRNARVTNIVDLVGSYGALPIGAKARASVGTGIKPAGELRYVATYWKEFGGDSTYEAYLEGQFSDVLLKTRSGERVVGAAMRKGAGALLLLPILNYDEESFVDDAPGNSDDDLAWTQAGIAYGRRLVAALVGIADSIRADHKLTPPPAWSLVADYRLQEEANLESQITEKTLLMTQLQQDRASLQERLRGAGVLRGLLYETGHPLEHAVLEALRLMGFTAERHADGESEFDAVFTSPEGRFLGEAEGKDNRAINIDKLSQLERNLGEDFARPEVDAFAKGVLFGNAYRLQEPGTRPAAFTEKCCKGATRLGVALVRTPDMFRPAQHLKQGGGTAYAKACREAIFEAAGKKVVFPEPPTGASGVAKTSD